MKDHRYFCTPDLDPINSPINDFKRLLPNKLRKSAEEVLPKTSQTDHLLQRRRGSDQLRVYYQYYSDVPSR